jgi:hypothetical protein
MTGASSSEIHPEGGSSTKHDPYDPVANPNVEHAFAAARIGDTEYLAAALRDDHVLKRVMRRAHDGYTLSHIAAEFGRERVLLLLRERGLNVAGATDMLGWKPIHVAAFHGHLKCVLLLAAREFSHFVSATTGFHEDAGINPKDFNGFTPMAWAAANGHAEIVAALRRLGSDAAAPNKFGHTPQDLAWQNIDAGGYKVLHALEEQSLAGDGSDATSVAASELARRRAAFERALRGKYNWHSPSGSISAARDGKSSTGTRPDGP